MYTAAFPLDECAAFSLSFLSLATLLHWVSGRVVISQSLASLLNVVEIGQQFQKLFR